MSRDCRDGGRWSHAGIREYKRVAPSPMIARATEVLMPAICEVGVLKWWVYFTKCETLPSSRRFACRVQREVQYTRVFGVRREEPCDTEVCDAPTPRSRHRGGSCLGSGRSRAVRGGCDGDGGSDPEAGGLPLGPPPPGRCRRPDWLVDPCFPAGASEDTTDRRVNDPSHSVEDVRSDVRPTPRSAWVAFACLVWAPVDDHWCPQRQFSGLLLRCRRTQYRWRGHRGRLGLGRSAWVGV